MRTFSVRAASNTQLAIIFGMLFAASSFSIFVIIIIIIIISFYATFMCSLCSVLLLLFFSSLLSSQLCTCTKYFEVILNINAQNILLMCCTIFTFQHKRKIIIQMKKKPKLYEFTNLVVVFVIIIKEYKNQIIATLLSECLPIQCAATIHYDCFFSLLKR